MLANDMSDADMRVIVVLDPEKIMGFATRTGHVGLEGPALELCNQYFFYFWNRFVPKFTSQLFFGENIRCMMKGAYCCFVNIEGEELRAVSLTDLGYIVSWFKNYEEQLEWERKRVQAELQTFPEGDEHAGLQFYFDLEKDPNKKKAIYFEKKPDKTLWTHSKGGRSRFGSWRSEGIKAYKGICRLIKAKLEREGQYKVTKEQDKAFVKAVRVHFNRDAVEARRQERKRKAPEPEEEESEGEDEMAFDD